MEGTVFFLVVLWVSSIQAFERIPNAENVDWALIAVDRYANSYEEFNATDGESWKKTENLRIVQPWDIEFSNGKIYLSGQNYVVGIFNGTTNEYISDAFTTTTITQAMAFLRNNSILAVITDWGTTLNFVNSTNSSHILDTLPCPRKCFDLAENRINSKLLVATESTVDQYIWNGVTYQFENTYIRFQQDGFANQTNTLLRFGPDNFLYLGFHNSTTESIYKYLPSSSYANLTSMFLSVNTTGQLFNFVFYPNSTDTLILATFLGLFKCSTVTQGCTTFATSNITAGYYVSSPTSLAYDDQGRLLVANWAWVLRLDAQSGAFIDQIIYHGGLQYPQAVSYNPDNSNFTVYISSGNKVLRFDRYTGNFMNVFIPAVNWDYFDALSPAGRMAWRDNVLYIISFNSVIGYDLNAQFVYYIGITNGSSQSTGFPLTAFDMKFSPRYPDCLFVTAFDATASYVVVVNVTSTTPGAYVLPATKIADETIPSYITFTPDGDRFYFCGNALCSWMTMLNGSIGASFGTYSGPENSTDVGIRQVDIESGPVAYIYTYCEGGVLIYTWDLGEPFGTLTPAATNYRNITLPSDILFVPVFPPPSPSSTPNATPSRSPSPSLTPSSSPTSSVSPSVTPSPTPSVSPSVTPTSTPSVSPSVTPSPTPSISPSSSPSPVAPSDSPSTSVSPSISSSPSYSPTPSKSTSGASKGQGDNSVAVGVGVGVGLAAVIAAIALVILIKKRKQQKDDEFEEDHQPDIELQPEQPSTSTLVNKIIDEKWEISFAEISFEGQEIGRGAFGSVYKAEWRNSDVVVKQLHSGNTTPDAIESFLKEAKTVKSLRNHKNVCIIFGVCTKPETPICIVMEYCSGGNLQTALQEKRISLTLSALLKIAKDVTSGMAHVHTEGIIHCDLACRNLLVSMEGENKFTVKISDFGFARNINNQPFLTVDPSDTFPIRWTGPEVSTKGIIGKASDVWSFGVTLWEIMQGEIPYADMQNDQVLKYVAKGGTLLPPTPIADGRVPSDLFGIMMQCWSLDMTERPSFDNLFKLFRDLEHKHFPKLAHSTSVENTQPKPQYTSISLNSSEGQYGNRLTTDIKQSRYAPLTDAFREDSTVTNPSTTSVSNTEAVADSFIAPPSYGNANLRKTYDN